MVQNKEGFLALVLFVSQCLLPSVVFASDEKASQGLVTSLPKIEQQEVLPSGEVKPFDPAEKDRNPQFEKHWVEKSREGVAFGWQKVIDVFDQWLSQDQTPLVNNSRIRLRSGVEFGNFDPRGVYDLNLIADLARLENRVSLWADNNLQLIVDSDADEGKTLNEQSEDRSTVGGGGAVGGVRFEVKEWDKWDVDFDLGIKTGIPFDPFTRVTFKRRYTYSPIWSGYWKHRLYAFLESDSGYKTDYKVYRSLAPAWRFENTLQALWSDFEQSLTYGEVVRFRQTISDRKFMYYSVGSFYEHYPETYYTNSFVQLKYVQEMYEDWFLIEVVPRLDWPEEEDYEMTPSLLIRFTLIFSN